MEDRKISANAKVFDPAAYLATANARANDANAANDPALATIVKAANAPALAALVKAVKDAGC